MSRCKKSIRKERNPLNTKIEDLQNRQSNQDGEIRLIRHDLDNIDKGMIEFRANINNAQMCKSSLEERLNNIERFMGGCVTLFSCIWVVIVITGGLIIYPSTDILHNIGIITIGTIPPILIQKHLP